MKTDELSYWLALWRMPEIGPASFAAILKRYPDVKAYFEDHPDLKKSIPWKAVAADLKWVESPHRHVITFKEAAYPTCLTEIASAPPLLFVQGDMDCLSQPQIAMVGSRHPTAGGCDVAHQFACAFVQQGLVVTSGLALGIDAASHEGALAGGGKTIGVMGTGPDQIYPKRHQALAQKISEQGCLVTEFPTGVIPAAHHFPRRNRLISGLGYAVLVVEAAYASGSLVTAKYALEQNREVFAIPGAIHSPLSRGCHALIKQGAKLVETVQDVLEELPCLLSLPSSFSPGRRENISQEQVKKKKETVLHPLLSHVDFHPTHIDLIITRSALTAEEVSSMLLMLELEGHVKNVPGGYQRLK